MVTVIQCDITSLQGQETIRYFLECNGNISTNIHYTVAIDQHQWKQESIH